MNLKAPKISTPFSSPTEEEKEALKERLNLYKDRLDDQWTDIKSDFAGHAKRAAVIGGVILGVYGLLDLVLPKPQEEEETEFPEIKAGRPKVKSSGPGMGVHLAGAMQSLLWTVAMSWAKEKVKDFVVAGKPADVESEG